MKPIIFLFKSLLVFMSLGSLISCSNSQVNPLIGDYQSSCTSSNSTNNSNCSSSSNLPSPAFERSDNSDIILTKLDKMIELSGKCNISENPDSAIKISITPQGYSAVTLVTGFMPIIGITTSGGTQKLPVAKCEKGRWDVAINTCANGLQAVGVHRIDLVLSGIDNSGNKVEITDGSIAANINRTETCL